MLLVLLHDFPEFLCDYHYGFCDVIPPNCIQVSQPVMSSLLNSSIMHYVIMYLQLTAIPLQMRNLILSAFPRNMRLPDPFTPNLKVEMLPDISIAPRTVANYAALIKPGFKKVSCGSFCSEQD